MKKIYATLTAVALGCAAIVAAPLGGKPAMSVEKMNLEFAPENATHEFAINKSGKVVKHLNVNSFAKSRSSEMPNVANDYLVSFEMQNNEYLSTTTLTQEEDVVTFDEFIFSDVNTFDGKLKYYEDYDIWTVAIPGSGQTVYFEEDGVEFGLWLYGMDPDDGKYYIWSDDIEFIIYEMTPGNYVMELAAFEDGGFFYGYQAEDGFYGGVIMQPELLSINCQTTSYWYDLENMAADPEQDVQPGFAFVDYLDEEGTYKGLFVFNFCGLPEPAVFLIDEANKAVVDAGAPVYSSGDIDFFMYPLYDDGSDIDIDGYVMGNYAINGNTTTVNIDQIIAVYGEDAGVADLFGSVEMVLDFSIEAAGGVSDIVANANKDTRIFNVMGVQVDENYKGIVISNGKKYIQR